MITLALSAFVLLCTSRGILLAARRGAGAPSWIALGAGCALLLALRAPLASGVAGLLAAGVPAGIAVASLLIARQLRLDHLAEARARDARQVEVILGTARRSRLSRRVRGRPGTRIDWPTPLRARAGR